MSSNPNDAADGWPAYCFTVRYEKNPSIFQSRSRQPRLIFVSLDVKRSQQIGTLLAASLALCFGIRTLWTAHASWYGMVPVTGGQAKALGVICIAFSIALFLFCFRHRRRTQDQPTEPN